MDFLPKEIENIIFNYKTQFEKIDSFGKKINKLKNEEISNDYYKLYNTQTFKTNICYLDVKDYLKNNKISYFKYQIDNDYDYNIDEDGNIIKTQKNNEFQGFSLRTDCDYHLKYCNITEVVYSSMSDIFYFKMIIV